MKRIIRALYWSIPFIIALYLIGHEIACVLSWIIPNKLFQPNWKVFYENISSIALIILYYRLLFKRDRKRMIEYHKRTFMKEFYAYKKSKKYKDKFNIN